MKIRIEKSGNLFKGLIPKELSLDSEVEMKKLMIVEDLLEIMEQDGITRTELAKRMGVGPPRITSMLNGTNNFTIETLIRAARAVNGELHQTLVHKNKKVDWLISEKFGECEFLSTPQRKIERPSMKIKFDSVATSDEPAAA